MPCIFLSSLCFFFPSGSPVFMICPTFSEITSSGLAGIFTDGCLAGRFFFSAGFFFPVTGSSSYGVQENTATDIGARLITIEFSLASHSSFFDILTLGFTMPLPPNCFASLFRISLYFPANGTPRRNFSCSTGTKLQTKSSVSSGLSVFLSKITIFSSL